jgi:(E)-4-hydroxy-3-methylbut-2-enyl-diphosphate synthase
MTNTETEDVKATVAQVIELCDAGSEIVRMTVSNTESAKAVPLIKAELLKRGYNVPLVGCFHYNGHLLLTEVPECAAALDKLRLNPGNVGVGNKRDTNFEAFIRAAIKYNKPIRIGANWGSLDQELIKKMMDENSRSASPKSSQELVREALVLSALLSAKKAEELGLPGNRIVLSCKVSSVPDLILVYEELARQCNYALHLGLTEAGSGLKGAVASALGIGVLLQKGIGNTIRVSITQGAGETRSREVRLCKIILQVLGLRAFSPQVTSCPGCGRTNNEYFQNLVGHINGVIEKNMHAWRSLYPGCESVKVAVMGCIVNGPGESKHADIGISLPGRGESPTAVVYADGKKFAVLQADAQQSVAEQFEKILKQYMQQRFELARGKNLQKV